MMYTLSLLALAFAVSLDSFGVGMAYGLRKMKIPLKSLLFIAGCSFTSILLSMALGQVILTYMPIRFAELLGGFILIMIGVWALYQAVRPAKDTENAIDDEVIVNFEIKMLGLVIRILRKPMVADMDNSGTITGREALLLGMALSLDAFGAGIGAALIGFSPLFMAFSVAIMSALFVTIGMRSGILIAGSRWASKLSYIPGLLLILIGVWKL